MARQAVDSKRLPAALAALLLLGTGCDRFGIVRSDDAGAQALARADSALARADSALALVTAALARLDTTGAATAAATALVPPDTTGPLAAVTGPGLDTLVALGDVGPTDSVAIAPTVAELNALRAAMVVPVDGVQPSQLVDSFDDARGGGSRTHNALDIAAPRGTTVRSATGGRLLKLFQSKDGGLMVYAADPSERFVLLYGHLDAYAPGLKEGMTLRRGQAIGTVGTTGNARGIPHLHFGIHRTKDVSKWWMGMPVDPSGLLKRAK